MTSEELIKVTNQYRESKGLPALKPSKELMLAAQNRANDMAKTGVFSHTVATTTPGVTPQTFMKNAGYKFDYSGENLAALFDNPSDVITAWDKSPSHKQNLLTAYNDVGFGIAPTKYQGKDTFFIVQFLGKAKATPVQAKSKEVPKTKVLTKIGMKPDMKMAQTTPQVVPNKLPPKPVSL